jgi:hypothetical protein
MQINIYDFDSTLAITKEKVIIKNKEGEILKHLNPHEYAEYQILPNEIPDYTDFKTVKGAEINKPVFDSFIRSIKNINSKNTTYILTARSSDSGVWIYKFLQDNNANLSQNHIITLDSSDPQDKSHWIKGAMLKFDIPSVFFCDDSIINIKTVNLLRTDEALIKKFGKKLKIKTKHINLFKAEGPS